MLRKINNIYVPTETEYAELSKIVDNKETMYDYIVAKTFEYDLWGFYHTNRFEEVPIDMYDTFIFESNIALGLEKLKALVKMYPEIALERLPLGEENRALAIYELTQNNHKIRIEELNCQNFGRKELIEIVKKRLEMSPRYRFEYRRYDAAARSGLKNQIDSIFRGEIDFKNIKNVQMLQSLIYIDPIYITKISDEEYLRIYDNMKVTQKDIAYLEKYDAILAINSFVSRYKFDSNILTRIYNEKLSDEGYEKQCKKLIRQGK